MPIEFFRKRAERRKLLQARRAVLEAIVLANLCSVLAKRALDTAMTWDERTSESMENAELKGVCRERVRICTEIAEEAKELLGEQIRRSARMREEHSLLEAQAIPVSQEFEAARQETMVARKSYEHLRRRLVFSDDLRELSALEHQVEEKEALAVALMDLGFTAEDLS